MFGCEREGDPTTWCAASSAWPTPRRHDDHRAPGGHRVSGRPLAGGAGCRRPRRCHRCALRPALAGGGDQLPVQVRHCPGRLISRGAMAVLESRAAETLHEARILLRGPPGRLLLARDAYARTHRGGRAGRLAPVAGRGRVAPARVHRAARPGDHRRARVDSCTTSACRPAASSSSRASPGDAVFFVVVRPTRRCRHTGRWAGGPHRGGRTRGVGRRDGAALGRAAHGDACGPRTASLLRLSKAGYDTLVARAPHTLAVFARVMAGRLARSARGRGRPWRRFAPPAWSPCTSARTRWPRPIR